MAVVWGMGGATVVAASLIGAESAAAFDYAAQGYGGERGEGPAYTIDRFAADISSRRATTIEEAIGLLPENVRSNYILMFRSRSLQKASFQKPRAIVFEGDASFIAAFGSGDRALRGGDVIETIQFRPEQRRWEFREIEFSPGHAPRVSEANPAKCLQCHQSAARADVDPRPNWEPYSTWPGAYGGADGDPGRILARDYSFKQRLRPGDQAMADEQTREAGELKEFQANALREHPRYRQLGEFKARNTLNLTQLLLWENYRRMARLATQTPNFDLYKWAFMELSKCRNMTRDRGGSFLPSSLPPEIEAMHEAAYGRIRAHEARLRGETRPMPTNSYYYSRSITNMVDTLFAGRGLEISDWSMDFKTEGRFGFIERMGGPGNNDEPFAVALRSEMPEMGELNCEQTQARGRAAWAEAGPGAIASILADAATRTAASGIGGAVEGAAPVSAQPLLARCARCHDGAGSGPAIPFLNERELAPQLARAGYPRGTLLDEIQYRIGDMAMFDEQMPPTGVVRPNERAALSSYLQGLVSQAQLASAAP